MYKIIDKEIRVKIYDKRESFNFEIVNYPHIKSNIPPRIAYGVFASQLIRYARACTHKEDIIKRIEMLADKLMKKDYSRGNLIKTALKCLERHEWLKGKLSYQEIAKVI